MSEQKNENSQLEKKLESFSKQSKIKLSADEWYRLDNAANVYPNELNRESNAVFRVSAVLKENVDEQILQQALNDCVKRFPTFMVTLKRGAFWHYFERMTTMPTIQKDWKYPLEDFRLDGRRYLFRVSYYEKRIAVEIYHSICDGGSAMIFLKSLLARYYELAYEPIKDFIGCKNTADFPTEEELEDSVQRYCTNDPPQKREQRVSLGLDGKLMARNKNVVTHMILQADKLKEKAKELDCTITEYLSAALAKTIVDRAVYKNKFDQAVVIQVPVDLRKLFPSETLRNFVNLAYVTIDPSHRDDDFETFVAIAKAQLRAGVNKKDMLAFINANVKDEKAWYAKCAPLLIKKIIIKTVKTVMGDKSCTVGFSNLGLTKAPAELSNMVDRIEFINKARRIKKCSVACVTYNNRTVISFARTIKEGYLERGFARLLVSLGLEVAIETNNGDNYEVL